MKQTLGLTGLTVNAMALIAPGALMWLTFALQCQTGAPMAGSAMWFGIIAALALCFATAIAYAELAKLYPGAGSSYYFAEQGFLSHSVYFKFARVAKFMIGWASHLYYWVYPGLMVGVTAILVGYLSSIFFPETFSTAINSPLQMILFCILFSLGVGYIAFRGVTISTGINLAINVIQISALIVFSVIAIAYRVNHHEEGAKGYVLENGKAVNETAKIHQVPKLDDKGNPVKDDKGEAVMEDEKDKEGNPVPELDPKTGKAIMEPVLLTWKEPVYKDTPPNGGETDPKVDWFGYHTDAVSVIKPHNFNFVVIQACIAILILVGFESVTAMGEEARNAKRDIPRAVLLSLFIQGVVCYLIQYFAANYFLNSGYKMKDAASSSAPIGDMMVISGTWLFGSPEAGKAFMLVEAFTVLLALVGTTLSCINTGARVTYAMGRDEEVPSHFGMLHGKRLTPHRAIWTLTILSAVIGIATVYFYATGPFVSDPEAYTKNYKEIGEKFNNVWYSFGVFDTETAKMIPNSFLIIGFLSNFGTFVLYAMTCLVAIVAFREHHTFSGIKHMVIPVFGLIANLLCMLFYLIGPLPGVVTGMSWKEPYCALGISLLWGIYGYWYFRKSSKAKGRSSLVGEKTKTEIVPGVS